QQFVQRLVEVAVADDQLAAVVGREQGGFADQLADEGGAGPLGPGQVAVEVGYLQRQPPAVQLEQPPPAAHVRQRDLDRLVAAPRPGGQWRLQDVRPVGRQQEQDVGVVRQAVHLVE